MRQGTQTTEFWTMLAVLIAGTVLLALDKISAEIWLGIAVGNGGIYTAARAYTKSRTAAFDVPLPEPIAELPPGDDV